MSDEMIALGRRAVACKGWRWMDGMKAKNDSEHGSVISSCWTSSTSLRMPDWRMGDVICGRWLPDLTDPATLGCLLAMVREAWGDPNACADYALTDPVWYVNARHEYDGKEYLGVVVEAATEAEALVAALEAAP